MFHISGLKCIHQLAPQMDYRFMVRSPLECIPPQVPVRSRFPVTGKAIWLLLTIALVGGSMACSNQACTVLVELFGAVPAEATAIILGLELWRLRSTV